LALEYSQLWVSSGFVNDRPSEGKGNRQASSSDDEELFAGMDAVLFQPCCRHLDGFTPQLCWSVRLPVAPDDLSTGRLWIHAL